MEDEDMKYCKICLVTDCKMFSSPSISEAYSQLVQVILCDSYKLYVCYECEYLLNKCQEFKSKCMMALEVLSSINMDHSKITKRIVRDIDRKYYKLESKLFLSSILVCNSNKQIVLPEPKVECDVKIEIDTNPDALKDEKSYIEDIGAGDPSSDEEILPETMPNIEPLPLRWKWKPDMETMSAEESWPDINSQDYLNDPKENIKFNKAQNSVNTEIKLDQKGSPKSKNTKENVPKKKKIYVRRIRKRKSDVLPLSDLKCIKKSSKMFEIIKSYTKIDEMTPSEAAKEMLLKKQSKNYKTSPLKCDLCYKGFTLQSTYNNHMKKHSPEIGTKECNYCHQTFRRMGLLNTHIEGCHKYKISCKSCPYVCFNASQAKNHIAIHKGDTYTCELCGMNFRFPNTLSNHKRTKHPECVCAHCGSMFANLVGLKLHKNRAHKQDSTELLGPKCEDCDVQFATETAWKRHLVLSAKHTVRNGCEECGETFRTAQDLRRHSKEHPQRLAIKTRYVKQLRTSTGCKRCDIRLETDAEYEEHMKSEHPKTGDTMKILKRQREVEEDNTQYMCEVCGKVFKSNALLKYHTNQHTGECPFECDLCDKKYRNPTSLYNHKVSIHSGAPQFKCDVCQRNFHLKGPLIKHMKMVHLGIRRFKCAICNKLFRHQCEVKTHMEYVHFKKPWPKRDRTKRRNKEDKVVVEYLDLNVFGKEEF